MLTVLCILCSTDCILYSFQNFNFLDLSDPCTCADWHGCIMKSSLSGEDGIQVEQQYINILILNNNVNTFKSNI